MLEEQKEIQKEFRRQKEKYVYYLIALAVTAIGFSVLKTTGTPLNIRQIPLAMAVLSWSISIYSGLTFLKYTMNILFANNAYFDVVSGPYVDLPNHPDYIDAATKGIKQGMESLKIKASKFPQRQDYFFYGGIFLFLFWHVLEMYYSIPIEAKIAYSFL